MVLEKTETLVSYQSCIPKNVEAYSTVSEWMEYKWQLNNSIKTVAAFENFTGISAR